MMRRSLLTVLLVLVATTSLAAAPPVNPADAIAFMNQVWNRAIELLNNKTDPAIKQARFDSCSTISSTERHCPICFSAAIGESAGAEEQQEFVRAFPRTMWHSFTTARLAQSWWPSVQNPRQPKRWRRGNRLQPT